MMNKNCAKRCVFLLCIVLAVSSGTTNDTCSGISGQKATWSAYMDYADEAIEKAKNTSVTCHDIVGKCGQKETLITHLEVADEMIKKAKVNFPTCDNCNVSKQQILECSDLLLMGNMSSGVYTIWPRNKVAEKESFDVYCDMETDGGGWTVIQRRGDFGNPVDYFNQDWKSYKEGFGDIEKEFWLGNDNIFALTNQDIYSARFDLVDVENNTRYALYDEFRLYGEDSKYTLYISRYSGDAGDSMEYSSDQKFSTKDQDNDIHNEVHCAKRYKGGWWFKKCFFAHLNGENLKGKQGSGKGKIWKGWKGRDESLARTEIKIRPMRIRS